MNALAANGITDLYTHQVEVVYTWDGEVYMGVLPVVIQPLACDCYNLLYYVPAPCFTVCQHENPYPPNTMCEHENP